MILGIILLFVLDKRLCFCYYECMEPITESLDDRRDGFRKEANEMASQTTNRELRRCVNCRGEDHLHCRCTRRWFSGYPKQTGLMQSLVAGIDAGTWVVDQGQEPAGALDGAWLRAAQTVKSGLVAGYYGRG